MTGSDIDSRCYLVLATLRMASQVDVHLGRVSDEAISLVTLGLRSGRSLSGHGELSDRYYGLFFKVSL